MKKRLITGISGALFAIALVVFMQIPGVMGIPVAFFSAVSIHEIMHVAGNKNKVITVLGMIVAAAMPLYSDVKGYVTYHVGSDFFEKIALPPSVLLIFYIIVILCVTLKMYDKTRFEDTAMLIFSSLAIGFSNSFMFLIRDLDHTYPEYFQPAQTRFFILAALYCAWLSDAFAYFFGRKLGKHKLAPKISPKKSVEGAVAGVLGTELITFITYIIASHYFDRHPDTFNFLIVFPIVAIVVIMGMCGDLTASVLKRNYGVKDYGTFFPGHGGVMDRFDSYLLTLPTTYGIITLIMYFAER